MFAEGCARDSSAGHRPEELPENAGAQNEREDNEEGKLAEVYVASRESIPAWYPRGQSPAILENGIAIVPEKPVPATGNGGNSDCAGRDYEAFLRFIRKSARTLADRGINSAELRDSEDFVWDTEASFAFSQGFRTLNKKQRLEFTPRVSADEEFQTLLKIVKWVRDTIDLPGNILNPDSYMKELLLLRDLAGGRFSVRKISGEELASKGYEGIVTVGKGSSNPPCLYVLDYAPSGNDAPVFASLVGKGITFDTGGYSLKPSSYMKSMHSDMGGSATVAGALALLAATGFPGRVKAYLACAENMISGSAMRIGDIIHYRNGVSAVVDNTDAEGRLVLADALIAAGEDGGYILDAATLTGAAKTALGREYHAVLALEDSMAETFLKAARETHEYAWRLPLEEFHLDLVKSGLADITNSVNDEPGATTAAAFLARFVKDPAKWAHIDLSASYQKTPASGYGLGARGHGIRSIARFVKDLWQIR
jgi:PepB aminopeptidase